MTWRTIVFGHVSLLAILASVYLIPDQRTRALVGLPLWLVGLPLLFGLAIASFSQLSHQMSTGMWMRFALDLAWMLCVVPAAMVLPGAIVWVATAQTVAMFSTENVVLLLYLVIPIGWIFAPPFLPYVWPVFIGRARRSSSVERPLAVPHLFVFGGALFVSAIILLLPGHSLIARVGFVIPWAFAAIVYRRIYDLLPRFTFPAFPKAALANNDLPQRP